MLKNLQIFKDEKLLYDIDFNSKFNIISGNNNCGKTTILNGIEGLLTHMYYENNYEENKEYIINYNYDKFKFIGTFSNIHGHVQVKINNEKLNRTPYYQLKTKIISRIYTNNNILLLDDIETGLHPKVQRIILEQIEEIYPDFQYIITTMSPFIIQAIETYNGQLINLHFTSRNELFTNRIEI